MIQQMLPFYIKQREIYEVREAPSRTFSWAAFISAQITSEVPFQIAVGTLSFFCWYYPAGFYKNAEPTDMVNQRGATMWLLVISFYVYTTTMGQLCVSFVELADNAANLANLLFIMCLNFCGVLAGPNFLPGFWIFMYRCNPFTYLIQAMLSTALANTKVVCATRELLTFDPTLGKTCGEYMKDYIAKAGGYLVNESATSDCQYCKMATTNAFLSSVNAKYDQRWRNYGIFVAFICINIILTIFFYWLARVPKGTRQKK